MGDEYVLPSGKARCLYFNAMSEESECSIPMKANKAREALIEALQQLYLMQRKIKELEKNKN